LFAVDLLGEPGYFWIVRGLQALEARCVSLLVEPVPGDRVLPVGQAQLDQPAAAVLLGLPVERELVGGRAEFLRGELVQRSSVPDLVLRDRREGDVLFEKRCDARPLGVPPAEDELVVSDREEKWRLLAHVP